MHPQPLLEEYLLELRVQVCSRCIERPEGGPPCGPLGKQCGIESHLSEFIDAVHAVNSARIDPYIDSLHERVCKDCQSGTSSQCPCPLKYLLLLAVGAIETVDNQHKHKNSDNASQGIANR